MPESILDVLTSGKASEPTIDEVLTATRNQILQTLQQARDNLVNSQRQIHSLIWNNNGVQLPDGRQIRPTPHQVLTALGEWGVPLFQAGSATVDYLNTLKPGEGDKLNGIPQGYAVAPGKDGTLQVSLVDAE